MTFFLDSSSTSARRWSTSLRIAVATLGGLLALAAGGCAWQYQQEAATAHTAPGQRVLIGDRHLHLYCTGQGAPTLVLEAGMAGWSQDWAWVQDGLAAGGRVCSYDRAGYGWSDAAPAPRLGMQAVDDLRRALLAAGEAPPWLLAGHSMGGLLVGMHARAYPADVAGLAFIDAVGRDYAAQFPPDRYARFRKDLGRLLALSDTLAPLGVLRLVNQPASLIAQRLPDAQRASAVDWSFSARHYRTLRDENAGFDAVLEQARALPALPPVPTVVLSSAVMRDFPAGLEDETMHSAWQGNQQSIAREAGVSPEVLAGSGHYLHVDQPDRVVALLSTWRETARHRLETTR
ncbi:alpha/beta fold hydrolase [Ralstonia insidiosa]|uniref:alpha/beta fold hydrolase n=1 Tax=Ralstonia insidiosa TaxID=190721 RepID=UPI000CED903D|nr:alpha/beta hydrolase [Ralstonia insidiosa]